MSSQWARLEWDAYVQTRGHDNGPFRANDELNRFLVGVKIRGELLSAAELAALLDEAGVQGAERDDLVARIEWGLSLLDAYTRQRDLADEAYAEVQESAGVEI
jgi:hypothetical protein